MSGSFTYHSLLVVVVFAVAGCCGNTTQEQNLSDCDSCVLVSEYHVPSRFTFHEFYLKKGDSISALHIKLQVCFERRAINIDLCNSIGGGYGKGKHFLLTEEESMRTIEQVIDSSFIRYGCPIYLNFEYMMCDWSDNAIETTEEYAKKHSNWQEDGIMLNDTDITNSIKETSMYKSIAEVLQKRGFSIREDISPVIYHPHFIEITKFKEQNLTNLRKEVPPFQYVIDCRVILSSSRDTTIDNGYEPMKAESGAFSKMLNKLLR